MFSIALNDGTVAIMKGILQVTGYWSGERRCSRADDELIELARRNMPAWRRASMHAIIGAGRNGAELFVPEPPRVLCVGEFVAYLGPRTTPKAVFRHFVWLQDDFVPHMSSENQLQFQRFDWRV